MRGGWFEIALGHYIDTSSGRPSRLRVAFCEATGGLERGPVVRFVDFSLIEDRLDGVRVGGQYSVGGCMHGGVLTFG